MSLVLIGAHAKDDGRHAHCIFLFSIIDNTLYNSLILNAIQVPETFEKSRISGKNTKCTFLL
jgi:hypothetical protein